MSDRPLIISGALLAASLLPGCSLAPAYVRPALPTAPTFPDAGPADAPSIAAIGWQTFFADPELQTLIATALANNRDLRIAIGRVDQARAAFRIEGAPLYPTLNGGGSFSRGRTPADLTATGSALTASKFQSALSAGWEIDLWGKLRNLRQAALDRYLATDEARRAVVVSLIAEVATGYLQQCALDERIALAARTITTRQESLRIARRRFEVGASAKLDMTQAQALLTQAETDVQALQQARAINHDALTLLVGEPIAAIRASRRLADLDLDRALPVGLPSALLIDRPDIRAAEYRLQASHADIGAARAAFFPNISLTGVGGTASARLGGLFAGGSAVWSFAPTVSLPIFDGGRNRATLDSARAARRIAVADYEGTIQRAFRDVADALAQRRWLAGQIATTAETLAALTERARLADLRYSSGRATYLEVLDAQRELFTTEQALVQLRGSFIASSIGLYAAVGGGGAPDLPNPEPTP